MPQAQCRLWEEDAEVRLSTRECLPPLSVVVQGLKISPFHLEEAADDLQEWEAVENEQFAAALERDHPSFAAWLTAIPPAPPGESWVWMTPLWERGAPEVTQWGTTNSWVEGSGEGDLDGIWGGLLFGGSHVCRGQHQTSPMLDWATGMCDLRRYHWDGHRDRSDGQQ
ncbi:hypothetical protein K438DRAFT_1958968 [Mycena galopus ATCC 62051]|nr:hypothetical protein K438DRAFT_1958968 [Mycena galopus ATCC 62051]